MDRAERAAARRVVRAPGRVNLIGDHTDYQGGWCLPLAIDRDVRVAWTPRDDGVVRVRSDAFADAVEVRADGTDAVGAAGPAWGRTVAAVVAVLARRGVVTPGFDAVVTSTVPVGSGLSSSAAFEVALAHAVLDAAGTALAPVVVAECAQEAEHLASGVPSGIMDQLAAVAGVAGHALLLDCRARTVEPIPLPPDLEIVVVHSGVARTLAATEYAARRAEVEAAAARLGVATLRDARADQVADDPRARHVVAENARVIAFAAALRRGDLDALGPVLLASHASLRDDYGVSTPELDRLVELLVEAGARGARLTGAGFGGCVVALTHGGRGDTIASAAADRYRAATGLEPHVFRVRAVAGAGPVDPADT